MKKPIPYQIIVLILLSLLTLPLAACARMIDPINQEPVLATQDPDAPVSSDEQPPSGNTASPLDPIPGEDKMMRGEAIFTKKDVLLQETYPLQVMLHLKGTLPTPCHHLRAKIEGPDIEERIQVESYSLYNPDEICIQVIQEFDVFLPLGSYPNGTYTIWLNGEKIGDFVQ